MLIFVAFVFAYAYPVQRLLAQENEIDRMESAQQAQREHIRELTEQLARWNDDDYVAAQARSRLHLVRQGELLYVVGADPTVPSPGQESQNPTWYGQLWTNLQAADSPVS